VSLYRNKLYFNEIDKIDEENAVVVVVDEDRGGILP